MSDKPKVSQFGSVDPVEPDCITLKNNPLFLSESVGAITVFKLKLVLAVQVLVIVN